MTDATSWIIAALVAALSGSCAGASKPTQPPKQCAAQICRGEGVCDAIVLDHVWLWNGSACVQTSDSGCSVVGPDCGSLYESKADCEAAWSACMSD
jgi:hypothetical protein